MSEFNANSRLDEIKGFRPLVYIHTSTLALDVNIFNNEALIQILNDKRYGELKRETDPLVYKESFQKLIPIYEGYKRKCNDVISKMTEI